MTKRVDELAYGDRIQATSGATPRVRCVDCFAGLGAPLPGNQVVELAS